MNVAYVQTSCIQVLKIRAVRCQIGVPTFHSWSDSMDNRGSWLWRRGARKEHKP